MSDRAYSTVRPQEVKIITRIIYLSGLKKPNLKSILLTPLLVILAYPFLLFTARLFEFLTPKSTFHLSSATLTALYDIGPVAGIILLALIPAIIEELLFRGIIFGILRQHNFTFALIISTSVFAVLHGNLQQIAYTFLFGILLCMIRETTGSVFPCMLAHLLFNSISASDIYINPYTAETPQTARQITFKNFWLINCGLFISAMLCLAGAVVVYALLKHVNNQNLNSKGHQYEINEKRE